MGRSGVIGVVSRVTYLNGIYLGAGALGDWSVDGGDLLSRLGEVVVSMGCSWCVGGFVGCGGGMYYYCQWESGVFIVCVAVCCQDSRTPATQADE